MYWSGQLGLRPLLRWTPFRGHRTYAAKVHTGPTEVVGLQNSMGVTSLTIIQSNNYGSGGNSHKRCKESL